MQAATICRRVMISSCMVLPLALVIQSRAMSDYRTEGFPPLAKVTIATSAEQIPLLMKELEQFAKDERLETRNGEFQRDGRELHQLTLKLDDETFFFMSNFKNKEHFAITAYSHSGPNTWQPIWQRLLDKLTQILGPDAIHRDIEPASPKP